MIEKLPVTAPPQLAEAIGYPGQARLVATYWEPAGDEAEYDDGRLSGDGEWSGFLAFTQHPYAAPHLRDYALGSSETQAKHWLLIDRETGELCVGSRHEVAHLLGEQWQNVPLPVLPGGAEEKVYESVAEMIGDFTSMQGWTSFRPLDEKAIMESINQKHRLIGQMVDWMNANIR